MNSPLDILLPYQRRWIDDASRFKLGVWSRQTGKDFSTAAEMVRDCHRRPGITWLLAAPSERQSLESLSKAKEWAAAFKLALAGMETERAGGGETLLKSTTINFQNGSRIIAVPGRPDTVRGFSANVTFTEAAFFDDLQATWRAVLPSITNAKRGGVKSVRLITTPNGQGDLIHKTFSDNYQKPGAKWGVHKVTIHDAVADGMLSEADVDELRTAMDDPLGFAVEFECEFLDLSNTLLPYDLIAGAESMEATLQAEPEFFQSRREFYCGIDFGRSNDPTVCWTLERVGDVLWTREVLVLRDMPSHQQEALLRTRIAGARLSCYDYTGPGIGLGDYLVKDAGAWAPESHKFGKLELCNFSANFKREIFPRLRRVFEAPVTIRVPVDREVREDLHEMRQISRGGAFSYESPRTKDGHSDRCTALALAVRAAQSTTGGDTSWTAASALPASSDSGSFFDRLRARFGV